MPPCCSHIEGKELFPNLRHINNDLFNDMPRLTLIHLAVHNELLSLPPLDGVHNLRSLVLAEMFLISELPSFEHIGGLSRLELVYLPMLRTLPDMALVPDLAHFASARLTQYCCNGFLGTCNLTSPLCGGNADRAIQPAQCLGTEAPRATLATIATMETFAFSVCLPSVFDTPNNSDAITEESINVCEGTLYRQCEYPVVSGQFGICYNTRMQVLSCVRNPIYITLRRAQIAANVGPACNPEVEKWLGCASNGTK